MFEDGMSYGLPLFKMAAQVDGAFFFLMKKRRKSRRVRKRETETYKKKEKRKGEKQGR